MRGFFPIAALAVTLVCSTPTMSWSMDPIDIPDDIPPLDDADGDGWPDAIDDFPLDPLEHIDTDGDGVGNNADPDDDGDLVDDVYDAFDLDASEQYDFDGDGVGDNADLDDDKDGIPDLDDRFPFDNTEWADTDGDGIGDNADLDDDGDLILDVEDDNPLTPDPTAPGPVVLRMCPNRFLP